MTIVVEGVAVVGEEEEVEVQKEAEVEVKVGAGAGVEVKVRVKEKGGQTRTALVNEHGKTRTKLGRETTTEREGMIRRCPGRGDQVNRKSMHHYVLQNLYSWSVS